MVGRKHEIPRMQSDFYKIWYHRIMTWILVSLVIIVCLILAIMYFILVKPHRTYYATTTEGQIITLTPLAE